MKPILVYGSREFGVVVKDLLIQSGFEFAGYIDDYNQGDEIVGNFEQAVSQYPPQNFGLAIAIGYNHLDARWKCFEKSQKKGYELPRIIHPKAMIRDEQNIGEGSFIMAGAIIDCNATLAPLVVAWPGAVVNHDSYIGPNSFLSPNSTICGCVQVGKNCFIGASATIVDHTSVPDNSFVKAGHLYKK